MELIKINRVPSDNENIVYNLIFIINRFDKCYNKQLNKCYITI